MKVLKYFIFIGVGLVVIGGILLGIAIGTKAFAREDLVTNEIKLEDDFNNFDIDIDIADLEFEIATENKVILKETKKYYHNVKVEDNKLVITSKDDYKWYERMFSFNFQNLSVKVELTKATFDNLDIKSSTGDIRIDNRFTFNDATLKLSTGSIKFSAHVNNEVDFKASTGDAIIDGLDSNKIKVETSTGSIRLNNIKANELEAKASTGSVLFDNVEATKIVGKTSTGNITLNACDATTMEFKASTGNIKGNVKSAMIFNGDSDTGKVKLPTSDSSSGKSFLATTDTGDIIIEIK